MTSTGPILDLKDVRFRWPGRASFSLSIPKLSVMPGETVLLLGESGSGKSTLLSLICGTIAADVGRVIVADSDMEALSGGQRDRFRAEQIGVVFQPLGLARRRRRWRNCEHGACASRLSFFTRRWYDRSDMKMTRRHMIASGLAATASARPSLAATPLEIGWDDLIPPGVPYAEIIGEGQLDEANDTWSPIFDANATKLNERLDGAYIRLPGFIIPLEISKNGVTDFVLVPYVGACIHVPPPPPNQLVFVKTKTPWPDDQLWDPVWVVGTMRTQLQSTEIAQTGYALLADTMETYEW